MEDSTIIALFFERDERAIAELSQKYGAMCNRVSHNILGNAEDAEECVNDALLAAWNTIPPARPDPLKTYILRLVRNISTARYHANTAAKRNSHYDVALDELAECLPDPMTLERQLAASKLSALFDRFLDTLDRDSRVMFLRRHWRSDSVTDLAEDFGLSPHLVSVKLYRIRNKLKKYLEKEGFES